MTEQRRLVAEAVSFIRTKTRTVPEVAIILGTGIGGLVDQVEGKTVIPYAEIPNFPVSTVQGHSGNLILGTINKRRVVVMQGRFHLYEGYSLERVVFPVRVMSHGGLGAKTLVVTNAAGGLNPLFRQGDLMLITDHINLMGTNPLVGKNDETLGPRFPDMSEPYSKRIQAIAEEAAADLKIAIRHGVFVGYHGPSLETRAEYRFLRTIGADAVGMSTVPEVIAAVHTGMEVYAMSIITNLCFPDALKPASHEGVIEAAKKAEVKLTKLIKEILKRKA